MILYIQKLHLYLPESKYFVQKLKRQVEVTSVRREKFKKCRKIILQKSNFFFVFFKRQIYPELGLPMGDPFKNRKPMGIHWVNCKYLFSNCKCSVTRCISSRCIKNSWIVSLNSESEFN